MAPQAGLVTRKNFKPASGGLSLLVHFTFLYLMDQELCELIFFPGSMSLCARAYHSQFGGHVAQLTLQMKKGDWEVRRVIVSFLISYCELDRYVVKCTICALMLCNLSCGYWLCSRQALPAPTYARRVDYGKTDVELFKDIFLHIQILRG